MAVIKVACGELEVHPEERRALLAGTLLRLTAREYALLVYLATRVNRAVHRSAILADIWREEDDGSTNVAEVYVGRLRRKFGAHAGMIETVRGFGYKLRVPRDA
jgi:DNA-binding response OmpR family regulator